MPPSVNTTAPVIHQNPPTDDEDFTMRQKWEGIKTILNILYDMNVALAVILGVIGVLMFLTIVNKKLRSCSPIWYMYHLIAMSVVTALLIHTFVHSGIVYNHRGICFFIMYTAEFVFLVIGINILLLNVEIYFTTVLPLQQWQSSPFFRFVVSMMSGWIVVFVSAVYVVINNNKGLASKYHCFYLTDQSARTVRLVLQALAPAALCFLFTIILIGTHCLKRSRFMISSASGELREVRTVTNEGEMEWTRLAVFVNIVFIVRTILVLIIMYGRLFMSMDEYVLYMVLLVSHATTLYLLPLGLLFISDARAMLKALVFKAIGLASCGKVRLGEDLEQLSVSFGQGSCASVQ